MRIILSVNQFNKEALLKADRLTCDGVLFIQENSKGISSALWEDAINKIGTRVIISEDGGTDREWLFNPIYPSPAPTIFINSGYAKKLNLNLRACLVYHEHPYTSLTHDDINLAYKKLGKKIIPLFRHYNFQTDTIRLVNSTLPLAEVQGICFEVASNLNNFINLGIKNGILHCLTQSSKPVYIILTPDKYPEPYEKRVKEIIDYLGNNITKSEKLHIILACYERQNNDVRILGKKNSIEAAIKVLK